MATNTANRAQHATLTPDTVDTVTLGSNWANVEVLNRSTSGWITFNVNSSSSPVIGADETYVVGPGSAVVVPTPSPTPTVVKLICASANEYSVTGL